MNSKLRASTTKTRKIVKYFISRAGASVLCYFTDEKTAFTNFASLQAVVLIYSNNIKLMYPTKCGPRNFVPVKGIKLLSPEEGQKGQKKTLKQNGFWFICMAFSETSKYGSWLQMLLLLFRVVRICRRNAYVDNTRQQQISEGSSVAVRKPFGTPPTVWTR